MFALSMKILISKYYGSSLQILWKRTHNSAFELTHYRADKKSLYVLLSKSQAGPGRNFSQPRTNTFSQLCICGRHIWTPPPQRRSRWMVLFARGSRELNKVSSPTLSVTRSKFQLRDLIGWPESSFNLCSYMNSLHSCIDRQLIIIPSAY